MAALVWIGFNVIDAWLVRQNLGLGAAEWNVLAPPFTANLLARGLMAAGIALILHSIRMKNLLWWLNLLMFALVCLSLGYYVTSF